MIHIITNHHETIKWLNLQATYLKKNTNSDYKVYCGITDLVEKNDLEELHSTNPQLDNYGFDRLESVVNSHADKLNYLVNSIEMAENNKDDLLVFLDPDALPVYAGWDSQLKIWLKDMPALAISREENVEPLLKDDQKPYPHPCFFVTTLGFWKKNNLSWELDPPQGAHCAGVLLKKWFDENKHQWGRLVRTNCFNIHPLNFGVYGEMIYHHGSGNRPVYDSVDVFHRPRLAQKYGVSLDLHFPELLAFNQKLSDLVFNEIDDNPNFIRMYFCGVDRE